MSAALYDVPTQWLQAELYRCICSCGMVSIAGHSVGWYKGSKCYKSFCVVAQDFFSFALIAALLYLVASAYYQLEKIK